MSNKPLVLVVSRRMNENRKQGTNEHNLIRCSASVRKNLNVYENTINIKGTVGNQLLRIHKAYISDIKEVKKSGVIPNVDLKNIGFVTSDIMKKLIGNNEEKIAKVIWEYPKLETLTMGADPEFLLFNDDNSVVRAYNVIQKEGSIGSDGAMIEVRPGPDEDPYKVVTNIRDIFNNKELTKKVEVYNWMAEVYHKDSARDYPVGGHIHIGNPLGIGKMSSHIRKTLFSVLNKILDELIAIPMIKLDGHEKGKARRSDCKFTLDNSGGYGFYGEWRTCDGHLEHRTLSGLWLSHPKLAYFVIGTSKAIAEAVYGCVLENGLDPALFHHPEIPSDEYSSFYNADFDEWDKIELAKIFNCTTDSKEMKEVLNNSYVRKVSKKFLDSWMSRMRSLDTYDKYSDCIEGLYETLSLPRREINKFDLNIKNNWIEGKDFII